MSLLCQHSVRPSRIQVQGFLQFSNRLACVKLRVPQGMVAIVFAYAPHAGYDSDVRQPFHEDVGNMCRKTSVNGMRVICGDLNSRLQKRLPGEEAFLGEHGGPILSCSLGQIGKSCWRSHGAAHVREMAGCRCGCCGRSLRHRLTLVQNLNLGGRASVELGYM